MSHFPHRIGILDLDSKKTNSSQGARRKACPEFFQEHMPRTASKPKKGAEIASKEHPEPLALEWLREEIKCQVGNEAENIVKSLIEEARKGNCAPAKYLFEMIGLYPAAVQEQQQENAEEDSLARTLLRRFGLPGEAIFGSGGNKEREVPPSAKIDGVE